MSCWVDYCLERELDERETSEDGWLGWGWGRVKPRVAAHEYCLEWQLDEREKGGGGGGGVTSCCG